jgi:hypothetical protein
MVRILGRWRRRLPRGRRTRDIARAHSVQVRCGDTLETGTGRAALTALPGFAPNISRDDCTAVGGQIVARPYAGYACALPDGTTQAIT